MIFKDRFRYVAKFYKIDQIDLARKLEIDPATVNRWWKGKVEPHPKSIRRIAEYFKCNYEWLSTGKGEIWPSDDPITEHPKKARLAELEDSLPKEIQEWMNYMEKSKPGFKTWLRLEFENRFPEFEKWKATKGN